MGEIRHIYHVMWRTFVYEQRQELLNVYSIRKTLNCVLSLSIVQTLRYVTLIFKMLNKQKAAKYVRKISVNQSTTTFHASCQTNGTQ